MKILFVDTYYPKFIEKFRKDHPKFHKYSYKVYKQKLLKTFFGTSDFYSRALRKLGHKADEIIVNDEILQRKWAAENNLNVSGNGLITILQRLPYLYRFFGQPKWIQEIALEQINKYKPDIVYIQNLSILNPESLVKIKKICKLVVGQIASPLPPGRYLKCFDLIISSFPHFVKKFREVGIDSEFQLLAFEPRALSKVGTPKNIYDVVFVGSFSPYHVKGIKSLEELAKNIPVHVWGTGIKYLSPLSPLRRHYHGEAWGLDMYKIFAKSKIVINRHISTSGEYANNMRMYESTGMGALLITDYKKNLGQIFKVGKEVVAYKNEEDLIKKVKYYLKNDREREKIAKAGQAKTLKAHNYGNRMEELIRILNKYLK